MGATHSGNVVTFMVTLQEQRNFLYFERKKSP
jgi:hypothetical protein